MPDRDRSDLPVQEVGCPHGFGVVYQCPVCANPRSVSTVMDSSNAPTAADSEAGGQPTPVAESAEPTTEAGRMLLEDIFDNTMILEPLDAILAIEAEARTASPVAESGLREALRSMIEHDEEQRDNCGDWGTNTCLIRERARAALAAAAPPAEHGDGDECIGIRCANPEHGWADSAAAPPTGGLDVERLAEAIRNTYLAPSASRDLDAENIATEYARLAGADRVDGEPSE